MELNNKQIIQLGVANESFAASLTNNESLADKVSLKLRMFIEYNTEKIQSFYDSLIKEEKRLAEKNFGTNLGFLGWVFFANKKELESFSSKIKEFEEEINTALKTKEVESINNVLTKYLPSSDKASSNKEKFNKEWFSKVEDGEVIEIDVKSVDPEWFDKITSKEINNIFIKNYVAAGAVKIQ